MLFFPYFVIALIILLTHFCLNVWKQRNLFFAARKMTGPPGLPIIGNGLLFACKREEILSKMYNITSKYYPGPIRFWLGPILAIIFPNPQHVEKILSSSKLADKYERIYKFPKMFIGNGLITGNGPKLKKERKIIQPMLSLTFIAETANILQNYIELCMENLEDYVNVGTFDIYSPIHKCMTNYIKDIFFGVNDHDHLSKVSTEFDELVLEIHEISFQRMMKPWYHSNLIFGLSKLKKRQDRLTRVCRGEIKAAIEDAYKRVKEPNSSQKFRAIVDRIAEYSIEHPDFLDMETFIDHLFTLFIAAEDTLAIISTFLAICLGMYPDCQKKAIQEIREVFGEEPRSITADDLQKIPYVTMCIEEVLRLFPIAPLIARYNPEDFILDGYVIPKGAALVVESFSVHRDPKAWEKPNDFYPEHFLPDAKTKRNKYSFIPFSAGPRGCIGKTMAYSNLRIFACMFLQRYEVEADGDLSTLKLINDISVRPANGGLVRIRKRNWNNA